VGINWQPVLFSARLAFSPQTRWNPHSVTSIRRKISLDADSLVPLSVSQSPLSLLLSPRSIRNTTTAIVDNHAPDSRSSATDSEPSGS
jgi:hypothetical protein